MDQKRSSWSSATEFILTCIGYSVGLGNIWRFPYMCFTNGGGAFLVPYMLMLCLCGIPLATLEFSMGQYVGLSALPFWDICPLFKGMGIMSVILNCIVAFYSAFVIVLAMRYLIASVSTELPWKYCGHEWNTNRCYDMFEDKRNVSLNITHDMAESSNVTLEILVRNGTKVSAAEEYLTHGILGLSSGISDFGTINWTLLVCLIVVWLLFYMPVIRGVKSYGKAVYLTATLPYVVLTVFVIRGALLPGSLQGIKYYLLPRWERLLDFSVWYGAATQIFYSLGIAFGAFITMASYNKFTNNCIRDAVLASLVNSATSIYAGFAVFSVLGFMAHESNVDIEDVIQSGPGLAFITYPKAMATMPFSQLWSVLFFLMLIVLGISSQCVHIETIISSFVDSYPVLRSGYRRILTGFVVVVMFVILGMIFTTQAGIYYFTLIDSYGLPFGLTTGALLECIIFAWIIGLDNISENIKAMTGTQPNWYLKICWKVLSPLILLFILICTIITWKSLKYGDYVYPSGTLALGWCLALTPLIPLPAVALHNLRTQGQNNTLKQKLKILITPSKEIVKHIKERRADVNKKSTEEESIHLNQRSEHINNIT